MWAGVAREGRGPRRTVRARLLWCGRGEGQVGGRQRGLSPTERCSAGGVGRSRSMSAAGSRRAAEQSKAGRETHADGLARGLSKYPVGVRLQRGFVLSAGVGSGGKFRGWEIAASPGARGRSARRSVRCCLNEIAGSEGAGLLTEGRMDGTGDAEGELGSIRWAAGSTSKDWSSRRRATQLEPAFGVGPDGRNAAQRPTAPAPTQTASSQTAAPAACPRPDNRPPPCRRRRPAAR